MKDRFASWMNVSNGVAIGGVIGFLIADMPKMALCCVVWALVTEHIWASAMMGRILELSQKTMDMLIQSVNPDREK